jgi:hypothetical protein
MTKSGSEASADMAGDGQQAGHVMGQQVLHSQDWQWGSSEGGLQSESASTLAGRSKPESKSRMIWTVRHRRRLVQQLIVRMQTSRSEIGGIRLSEYPPHH